MKRFISLLMTVILVCCILGGCGDGPAVSDDGESGSGGAVSLPSNGGLKQNADGFYEIYTEADFVAFREIVEAQMRETKPTNSDNTASACLMADIDLSSVCSEELGSWRPIGFNAATVTLNDGSTKLTSRCWNGVLEGNGHTISGLYVDDPENDAGLFYEIWDAEVRNLVFADCYLRGGFNAGTVAAKLNESVISNVTIESTVTVSGTASGREITGNIGGVVGFAERRDSDDALEFRGCVNKGTVTGHFAVGGIVGRIKDTKFYSMGEKYDVEAEVLIDCENQGAVSEAEWSGELVGQVYS